MARLDAIWLNFSRRGAAWDHFWQDAAAVTSVSAAAAMTEGADTITSTATLALSAQSTITEVADTASATGTLALAVALAVQEAGDTAAAVGTASVSGAAAHAEESDQLGAAATSAAPAPAPGEGAGGFIYVGHLLQPTTPKKVALPRLALVARLWESDDFAIATAATRGRGRHVRDEEWLLKLAA